MRGQSGASTALWLPPEGAGTHAAGITLWLRDALLHDFALRGFVGLCAEPKRCRHPGIRRDLRLALPPHFKLGSCAAHHMSD